jgi:hypothetical protein
MVTETDVPDKAHFRIMGEVGANPNCTINHVVSRLLPGLSESTVRSGVRLLLAERYLDFDWKISPPGVHLMLTSKGREALLGTAVPIPFAPVSTSREPELRRKFKS